MATTEQISDASEVTAPDLKMPEIEVQNVVSTFFLGVKNLDLKSICSQCKFLEFNPHKFAAATVRLKKPRTTALIFGSGNMVCTGAKTARASRLACRQCVNVLQRSGLHVGFSNFKVQNIVGSTGLDVPINLVKLHEEYGANCSYEPELFPGLIFRLKYPKIVYLLFRSGRLVVTGAKTERELKKFWKGFYDGVLVHYMDINSTLRCSSEYRYKNQKKDYSIKYFYDALQ